MDQRLQSFFLGYEEANRSSDPSAFVQLYAEQFMFGGPAGVHVVKLQDFLKVIPVMKAKLVAAGLIRTELQGLEVQPFDARYAMASVTWRITIQRTSGVTQVTISATYVLAEQPDASLRIILQIDHQDLSALIVRHATQSADV